jgi:hypothetical protein
MKLAGIILMLAGVAALIYGGITYTTHKKAIDMGPLQVTRSDRHHIPLPPILGIAFIAGGGFLAFAGAKAGR